MTRIKGNSDTFPLARMPAARNVQKYTFVPKSALGHLD